MAQVAAKLAQGARSEPVGSPLARFSAPVGTVAQNPNGPGFVVTGPAHTYGFAGTFLAAATITDDGSNFFREGVQVTVANPLTATGLAVTGVEGLSLEGAAGLKPLGPTLATFTAGNPNATASDFTAKIDWGDGTTSDGTTSGSGRVIIQANPNGPGLSLVR